MTVNILFLLLDFSDKCPSFLPRPPIRLQDLLYFRWADAHVSVHGFPNHPMNLTEPYAPLQKGGDRHLVGGVEHRRHGPSRCQTPMGQTQSRISPFLDRKKSQLFDLSQLEWPPSGLKPVGKGKSVGDRYPHVRDPQLSDDRPILVSDHRV